jgi:hypothetical protein
MLRLFTIVSSVFQVFQTYVLFVFKHILQLLYLNVSKLDRVLHLSPRLSVVSPRAYGGRSRRDVDGLAGDTRQEAAARASGRGLASGRLDARHAPKTFTTSTMGISITKMAAAQ